MSAGLPAPVASVTVTVPDRFELRTTLGQLGLGSRDRCARAQGSDVYWRATRTPVGAATVRYSLLQGAAGREVRVDAWGAGAGAVLDAAPAALGVDAEREAAHQAFLAAVAGHPLLGPLAHARSGWRIGAGGSVYEALLPTILSQKVTGLEAKRAWNAVVDRWGEGAPGPYGLRLAPPPERLAELGYHAFHPLGVERKRAEVLRTAAVAAAAGRLDGTEAALRRLPGIGIWTAAEVRRIALGDGDAVSYGDYHLPHLVSYSLLAQRRGSDELMAELLAPFAPHRGRVVRLLELAGTFPPRRGPRLAPNGLERR